MLQEATSETTYGIVKIVSGLLKHYHQIRQSDSVELVQLRIDLERALEAAPLTYEERYAIYTRFLVEPGEPPNRTGLPGRPRNKEIVLNPVQLSRTLQSAYKKVGAELGEDYVKEIYALVAT